MKSRCKQRVVGSKGGLDRGINEPNLSGAYIRSLVRQLSSSKNHANPGDFKTGLPKSSTQSAMHMADSGSNGRSTNAEKPQDGNGTHKPEVSGSVSPVCAPQQLQKKQIRRRPHTRKRSQDFPLDIAEARREIVTALHLHRAAASKLHAATNQTESQNLRNNTNASSNHNTNLYNQSGDMSRNGSRCNSCTPKGAATLHKEAKAITICGHLLCWTCLSEYLLYLSTWVVKGCPVCAKPLTTNHIFPIAAGVPILIEQSAACTTSVLLQSSPLLINSLPLPQPAWSTTGPSLGITMDGISSTIDMNMNHISEKPTILNQSVAAIDDATAATFSMASQSPESDIGSVNLEQGRSIKSNWHVAMDEDELTEIRSLGEQHEMEWSDSVNLATSSWWFKFLKTSEFNPETDIDILYKTDFERSHYISLENVLNQDEASFYPDFLEDPLNTMNESLYISSELPVSVESLWPDEWFDYDWFQYLKNQDTYNENFEIELDENHLVSISEVFKDNKSSCDQDMSDDITDLGSNPSSDNPKNNAGVSGDKRKRDCSNN